MRLLDEFKLLSHHFNLSFLLLCLLLESAGLVRGCLKLRFSRGELRIEQLLFLAQIFNLTLQLVHRVAQIVVLAFNDDIEIFLFEGFLLKAFIPHSIRLVLLHHDIMVSLQELNHLVFLYLLCDIKVQQRICILTQIGCLIGLPIVIASKSLTLELIKLLTHDIVLR